MGWFVALGSSPPWSWLLAGSAGLNVVRGVGPRAEGLGDPWSRVVAIIGAIAIVGACAWYLRGLSTPTVGFDARAVWLSGRDGSFSPPSAPHGYASPTSSSPDHLSTSGQCVNLPGLGRHWRSHVATGSLVIALLNTCALGVAAFALVDAGRHFAHRLVSIDQEAVARCARAARTPS